MMRSTPRGQRSASRKLSADSCGCAMGARFLGVALVASIVWYALHWHKYSLARAGARILIFAFVAAILGKVVGIVTYRLRTRRLRDVVSAITRRSLPSRRLKVTREDGGEPHQPDYAGAYSDATRG